MLCKNFQATTNSTLICGLSFLARFAGNTAAMAHCTHNGRYLYARRAVLRSLIMLKGECLEYEPVW